MLDIKQIRVVFLFEFKMSYTTAGTTCTDSSTCVPGAARSPAVQRRLRKSYEGDRVLKIKEPVVGRWRQQSRAIIEADPLTTTWEVAKEFKVRHSMVIGIWNKLERWKSSVSGSLVSWPQVKTVIVLKCRLLFYATITNHFSVRLWCVIKSGF